MDVLPVADPGPRPDDHVVLRAPLAAHFGRYRSKTRVHTESGLRVFLRWCADQHLDPLAAVRVDMSGTCAGCRTCRHQPSTVSRRLSVVIGFYRVCVIDQILPHSPADYVRRPTVPAESPTLGLGHLQFEALITTARLSPNPNDYALVAILGMLGCGSSKPAGPASATWVRSTATACCGCAAKAARWCSCRCRRP